MTRSTSQHRLTPMLALLLLLGWSSSSQAAPKGQAEDGLESRVARGSYALGVNLAQSFSNDGLVLDLAALLAGLEDGLERRPLKLDPAELRAGIAQLRSDAAMRKRDRGNAQVAANREEGLKYLAANRQKEGVVETASGLQYRILEPGDGRKPAGTDRVTVHYRGTTIDGAVFDESYSSGEPAVFLVHRVVAGWAEALQLMRVGSKWQLALPANLGYGASPPPGTSFGPDAVLLFEVELLAIE